MKHLNAKTISLLFAAAGALLGAALRLLLMNNFFDYDTCFYTDGGLMAWLSLAVPVLSAAGAALVCWQGRAEFAPLAPKGKRTGVAALTMLSGIFLLRMGANMAVDYRDYLKTGFSQYASVAQGGLHVLFVVASLVFGLVQLAVCVALMTEKDLLGKLPLLYIAAPLWGISNLILVYLFYAKSSSTVENFFAVVGAAALLLGLFYICKISAGVDEVGATKRLFVSGGLAVALGGSYSLGNVTLFFMGRTYTGEMPVECQLCALVMVAFVLVFMVDRLDSRTPAPAEQETASVPLDPGRGVGKDTPSL